MAKVIDNHGNGLVKLLETTLTDGSKVFDIEIGTTIIMCDDEKDAAETFAVFSRHPMSSPDYECSCGTLLVDKA